MKDYISVKKASEILQVTPHYIRKLVRDGKINGHQIEKSNRWEIERKSLNSYLKTDIYNQDLASFRLPQQITIKEAVENIEDVFEADVITYIMNSNLGGIIEPNDALQLDNLLSTMSPRIKGRNNKKFKKILLVVDSGGGIIEAAIKFASIIKTYANVFEVVVPVFAKSAATILCLEADKLYMTTVSELGPIDPIVQSPTNPMLRVPASSIRQFIDQYGRELKDTDKTPLDEILLKKLNITVDPYLLGAYRTAENFAEDELIECLSKYYLDKNQLKRIKELFLHKKSHSYPILFEDIKEFGISERISEEVKLGSIKILISVFNNFMNSQNIIKIIGNRDQNQNTAIAPEQIKQRLIQTGN